MVSLATAVPLLIFLIVASSAFPSTRQRSNELDDLLYLNRGYTRAKAACEAGHLHEALEIAQNVVDGRSEMLGHDHEDTKHARRLMAAILHSLGRHDEAKHLQVTPQTELCSNQQARNITIINHVGPQE